MQNDLDANYNELCEVLDDHISVVTAAKDVYDAARFSEIIGTHRYLCDAKIAVYKQNNIDLRALKDYIKAHCIERYNSIFVTKRTSLIIMLPIANIIIKAAITLAHRRLFANS